MRRLLAVLGFVCLLAACSGPPPATPPAPSKAPAAAKATPAPRAAAFVYQVGQEWKFKLSGAARDTVILRVEAVDNQYVTLRQAGLSQAGLERPNPLRILRQALSAAAGSEARTSDLTAFVAEAAEVTVAAGTFDATHVTVTNPTDKGQRLELWADDQVGLVKLVAADATFELVEAPRAGKVTPLDVATTGGASTLAVVDPVDTVPDMTGVGTIRPRTLAGFIQGKTTAITPGFTVGTTGTATQVRALSLTLLGLAAAPGNAYSVVRERTAGDLAEAILTLEAVGTAEGAFVGTAGSVAVVALDGDALTVTVDATLGPDGDTDGDGMFKLRGDLVVDAVERR